uniref:Nuclear pore localisation protein NPL4 C-terminal domain-containing protein n=2 Tax=Phaeomonas parva TaxID=124430 RepID=A0A7S1XS27_9STRA
MSRIGVLRIRSQMGTWRVKDIDGAMTVRELMDRVATEKSLSLSENERLCASPSGSDPLPLDAGLASLNVKHGDMLYIMLTEENQVAHEEAKAPRKVDADGNVRAQEYADGAGRRGFRPGMLPLRAMKMQWTLTDFLDMDARFVFKMKRQEDAACAGVDMETNVARDFQQALRQTAFQQCRVGYLYGTFTDDNKVKVKCLYEPPQRGTAVDVELLEDPREDTVEKLAALLGLRRVGWIFGHPPREEGFHFASPEVFMAAEQQLEAAGGIGDTPFVTIKVTCNAEGLASVEGFQVSKQCMEMVAEGALEIGENPGDCAVNETFTAIVEGKEAKEVNNNFFLINVAISQYEADDMVYSFPVANREELGTTQGQPDLRAQIESAGKQGWCVAQNLTLTRSLSLTLNPKP